MRTRAYLRKMRKKHIKRKKSLDIMVNSHNSYSNETRCGLWYKFDGQYSKGKIHCSCSMCAFRGFDKNQKTESDMRKIESMNQKEKDFYECYQ